MDWGALAQGVSGFANFGLGIANTAVNANIANQNLQLQKETNQKNEELMREAWARDDNARQRMVADLESAGLSKWLATGASPSSSSPIQLQSPQNEFKMNMNADALEHMYQNYLNSEQTRRQNELIDKQGQVLSNNVVESEAKARIAQHDAKVFEGRHDVASTDPAYMKYISEALNTLAGRNQTGSQARDYFSSLANSVKQAREERQKAREERQKARAEKKEKKELKKDEVYLKQYGYERRKPLSMSDWAKTTQTKLGSYQASKLYDEYVKNFYKYAK